MGNIQQIIAFITLLNIGCVLSQAVTWVQSPQSISVREGSNEDRDTILDCHYKVDLSTGDFDWLPSFYKFQDIEYVEDQISRSEDIETTEGFMVTSVSSVKGDYGNILNANMETWKQDNSDLGDGERRLRLTITAPKPTDSGKYVCHIEHDSQVFQRVYTVTVLPSSANNLIDIYLTGMTDATDNSTIFKDGKSMIYYGTDSTKPYGVIECKACDGASEPIIKMTIGDDDITGNIPKVEGYDVTLTGVDNGEQLQEIRRCVTRRQSRYQLTTDHNGKEITCSAVINNDDGTEFAKTEVKRPLIIFHVPQRRTPCAEIQQSPLNTRGQIQCSFSASPSANSVKFVDRNSGQEYEIDVESGNGWSATIRLDGSNYVATLTFEDVQQEYYSDYYLEVQNSAGTSLIEITFQEGEATTGEGTQGASGIHCAFSLLLTSLLLTIKLLTL